MKNLKILALLIFILTSIILLNANNEEIDQIHQTATPKKRIVAAPTLFT